MDPTNITGPLLPKLVEFSILVTILVLLLGVSLYANYKQWQKHADIEKAHSLALAEINDKRLIESKDYSASRKESSDQLREFVSKFQQVLTSIEHRGDADDRNRSLLLAIADELKIPLINFL